MTSTSPGVQFEVAGAKGIHSIHSGEEVHTMDKSTKRAWTILGVIFALFMIGLFMVSMWGGPYQADSSWLKEETPTFPN